MKILPDWSTLFPVLDRLGAQPAPMITHLDDGQPLAALPIEKIVAHVHRVCREYNHEIDESVANWSLGELLPECSWKALAWRRQRIGAAHSFLMFLNPFTRRPKASLFQRRNVSDEEAIQWLLTDWWYACGVTWYAHWLKVHAASESQPPPSF
jgi:hypothetical protein